MIKNTIHNNRNTLNIKVQVALFLEDDIWVAYCPALELSSYGDNKNEAKEAFEEAMQIFLTETERKGTLEKYLLKLGWQLQQKPKPVYNQPQFSITENKRLQSKSAQFYNERMAIPVA